MVRKTGILTQEQVDELIKEKLPSCGRCEDLKIENKAISRTMNKMIDQYSSQVDALQKVNRELRSAIDQATKD
jgi:transcription elongation factor Elf1